MNNYLFDTHFHLDLMSDVSLIAEEIEKNKIYTIAVTNLPVLYNTLKEKLNNKYKYIRPALGFHPELLEQYQKYIPKMWEYLPNAKYIGEVGLDFKTGNNYKQLQIRFFEELIGRCNDLGEKVLTIHSRKSADDIIDIIGNNFNSKYILHWYSGSIKTLNLALERDAYFSVNYAMTTSDLGKKIITNIPIDRLLLETDGPFIKFNNVPFTPSNCVEILKRISNIKNIPEDELNSILFKNFKEIIS